MTIWSLSHGRLSDVGMQPAKERAGPDIRAITWATWHPPHRNPIGAGMHLARNRADPELKQRGAVGGPRVVAFASEQSHYSYLKAAALTGLGSNNLVSVACDGSGAMCPAGEASSASCLSGCHTHEQVWCTAQL